MMLNPASLCQIEIQVSSIDRSLAFYEQAFGWKRVPAEIHNYYILDTGSDSPYGISLVPGKAGGTSVTVYFRTEQPQAVIAAAEAAGGRVMAGPRQLPGYGTLWHIGDPDGNRIGLFSRPKI